MAKVSLKSLVTDDDDEAPEEVPAAAPVEDAPTSVTVTNPVGAVGHSAPKARGRARRGPIKTIATVYTANPVFQRLRQHVASCKVRGDIVSYGVVTLLAVQANADELSRYWTEGPGAVADGVGGDDMFGVTVRKAGPKKVPWQLHGTTAEQVALLDGYAEQWGAPSRSELVEVALNMYLGPARRARRG